MNELTPADIAVAMTNEQIARQSLMAAFSEVMPKKKGKEYLMSSKKTGVEETHKPAGVRLAKMLNQCDDQPSSQLWSDIQRLAREILK